MKTKKYFRFDRGFTLLELLVVIGIIGVMMALATVAYATTQRSGRDARRKQDLVAMQNALEQYYSVTGFSYPVGNCNLAATYMKSSWPLDPDSTTATPIPYSGDANCTTTSYCICAQMEGSGGNSGAANCGGFALSPKNYYCVGNLQ